MAEESSESPPEAEETQQTREKLSQAEEQAHRNKNKTKNKKMLRPSSSEAVETGPPLPQDAGPAPPSGVRELSGSAAAPPPENEGAAGRVAAEEAPPPAGGSLEEKVAGSLSKNQDPCSEPPPEVLAWATAANAEANGDVGSGESELEARGALSALPEEVLSSIVTLETHENDPAHGDVCRQVDGGHYCPRGCVLTPAPPYCSHSEEGSSGGGSGGPCRRGASEGGGGEGGEEGEEGAGEEGDPEGAAEAKDSQAACGSEGGDVAEWAVGKEVDLERHDQEPAHGDVCRVREGGLFFCPHSCTQHEEAPYCSAGSEGDSGPCRAHRLALLHMNPVVVVDLSSGQQQSDPAAVAAAAVAAVSAPKVVVVPLPDEATPAAPAAAAAAAGAAPPSDQQKQPLSSPPDPAAASAPSAPPAPAAPPAAAAAEAPPPSSEEQHQHPPPLGASGPLPTLSGFGAEVTRLAQETLRLARQKQLELVKKNAQRRIAAKGGSGGGGGAGLEEEEEEDVPGSGHLLCSNFKPDLLTLEPPLSNHEEESHTGYVRYYDQLEKQLERSLTEDGDVVLTELFLDGRRPAKLFMGGRGDVMSAFGWNDTHSVPEDPLGRRSGGSLIWAPPPKASTPDKYRKLNCTKHLWLEGPLIAFANWFPGNFHHWLHDSVPILFFLNRFRAPPSARFALPDRQLHRKLLGWFDPDLARRVDWIGLGEIVCLHDASVSPPPNPAVNAVKNARAALEKELASFAAVSEASGIGPPLPPLFTVDSKLTKLPPVVVTDDSGAQTEHERFRPSLVAVQYRSAMSVRAAKNKAARENKPWSAADLEKWPPFVDGATIFNLRNAALSRLMALEIARLKPPLAFSSSSSSSSEVAGEEAESKQLPKPKKTTRKKKKKKKIVFYRRWSSSTLHGRTMALDHEERLFKVIRAAMTKFDRPEELVVFSGENAATGKTLTFQEQFDIFRDASMVIGPHGAGLANIVWLQPSSVNCAKGPVVLEFICTKESSSVQTGCPGKTHWSLLGGTPWIRYHHLFLARNSTAVAGNLFVEANELEHALNTVFLSQARPTVQFPRTVDATKVIGTAFDPLPMLVPADLPPATSGEVPYFFHMPKAAGTSIERILSTKRQMKTLPAGDLEDLTYVERSQALKRKIISYVKTPLFYDACAMLGRGGYRARAFTILREPVGRIVSLFWYKKDSTWEKSFDPKYRNQSMELFLTEDSENNWLVYSLATAVVERGPEPHRAFLASEGEMYAAARWVLMERLLVGFMDDMETSCAMIFASFGWEYTPGDIAALSRNVNTRVAKPADGDKESKKKKGDDPMATFIPRIRSLNQLDVSLYTEAKKVYEQRKLAFAADVPKKSE